MVPAPVNTCHHPVKVFDGSGYNFYPCGSCPSCRRAKSSKWRQRLDLQQNSSSCTLFITLTYSDDHLPKVTLDLDTMEVKYASRTSFKCSRGFGADQSFVRVPLSVYDKDPYFIYTYTNGSYNPSDIPHFKRNNVYDDSPTFGVCCKEDVQDFIKRLRIALDRAPEVADLDTRFTYFICSEYGPTTFRPHYHGLLFFRDSTVASLCNARLINECWRKSDLNEEQLEKQSQIVSHHSCSPYVSKYVTCNDVLPSFLRYKFFQPFHTSSHSTPIGSEAIPPSLVSHTVRKTDLSYTKVYYDKDTDSYTSVRLSYPPSLWSRYFPKFLFSGLLDVRTISLLYSRIFELPFDAKLPDLVASFNEKFGIGDLSKSSKTLYVPSGHFDTLFGCMHIPRSHEYNYDVSDYNNRITYSSILPDLLNDPNYIDYFLFGIPQNRTVCYRILRLRRDLRNSPDNWCSNVTDYLYHYYLYYTKSFHNSLTRFYENMDYYTSDSKVLSDVINEYYPSFATSLPREFAAILPATGSYLDDLFISRFDANISDLYDSDGILIDFDYRQLPRYINFDRQIQYEFDEFNTKRKANYDLHPT